jgi:ABC-type cobalt transport system substrate-binding protein
LPGKFGSGDGGETDAMKSVAIAAAILALLALPAQAQMGGKHRGGDTKSEQKKPQVDEKAYKAALERIPEPKEKYDPWGVARPTEPGKKTK